MTLKFFGHIPKEHLPDIPHDICRCNNDGNTRNHCNQPLSAPHPHEDWEFSDETRKERHPHGNETANDKTNRRKRHNFRHTTTLRNLTGMRPIIDHTYHSKEKSSHDTMQEHLQTRAK